MYKKPNEKYNEIPKRRKKNQVFSLLLVVKKKKPISIVFQTIIPIQVLVV